MGRYIIRASREDPTYGVVSTIVDNFICGNWTRAEMLEYLLGDFRPGTKRYDFEREAAEERLDMADQFGSDSWIGNGSWGDEEITIMNNKSLGGDGRLPRDKVGEFMRRADKGEPTADLLLPFEEL